MQYYMTQTVIHSHQEIHSVVPALHIIQLDARR